MTDPRIETGRLLTGLALALCALALRPQPALAQQADPRIETWLHHSIAGIHSSSTNRPEVRLLDPDGVLRAEGAVGSPSADGRWPVEFSPNVPFDQPRTLIHPGDRIEVSLDGELIEYSVPDLQASANVETDTIEGRAPSGTAIVGALLHRDAAWFDAPTDYPIKTQLSLGGAFSIPFTGEADIGPGYSAEAIAIDGAGHLTVLQLAPPSLTIADTQSFAILRADAGKTPILTTRNSIDTELFRSAPAYALGGSLYAVLMVHGGNPDFGVYQPEEGERIILLLEDDAGAEPALEEPLPRALGAIDREASRVWGLAPAGARVSIELDLGDGGSESLQTRADDSGSFTVETAAGVAITKEAVANIQVYPGGALARVARAIVPSIEVLLHGNLLAGSVPSWGQVEIHHLDAQGRSLAVMQTQAGPQGEISAELRDRTGQATRISPGDRLLIQPELGRALDLLVPPLSAEVDEQRRVLSGRSLANIALDARAYNRDPSVFDVLSLDDRFTPLAGRSDATGAFALACQTPDCATRYGTLTAETGLARYTLKWIDQPIVGLGVTEGVASGRASAGLPLSITALDSSGQATASLNGYSTPLALESLPGWDIPLAELYPEGLRSGDRLDLDVGSRTYAIEVPDFSWEADVATNGVSGSAPIGRLVAVVAFARGEPDQRPDVAVATAIVGPLGRWQASFPDFDLRSGDDLELYLFEGADRFLWWSQESVEGIDPPTRTPTPTSEPIATPTPVAPPRSAIYLPNLRG